RPIHPKRKYADLSVIPRSMWEPWLLFRKPLDGRVRDNLKKWNTGALRRPSRHSPFGDVIRSSPAPPAERKIAPHPSLKPQAFLRQAVRALLPFGKGVLLDTFAGSGSTLAAAQAVGVRSIGLESVGAYCRLAVRAVPQLASLHANGQLTNGGNPPRYTRS